MEHDHNCPACKQAALLGFNEEQGNAFHRLVQGELEVFAALSALEGVGVDFEDRQEIIDKAVTEAIREIVGQSVGSSHGHTIN